MRSKSALQNSIFNIVNLLINTLLNFILRKYLVTYLGVEILGVNSVIAETINTLLLSEMGIQTAIIFRLYKPISEGNQEKEGQIFSLFKNAYRIIGTFIFVTGLLLVPFLKYIINTKLDMQLVYTIYFIQLFSVALSYWISYRRVLFIVHERQYYCIKVDLVFQTLVTVMQLVIIIVTKNYVLYLIIGIGKGIITNTIISQKCKRDYSFINKKYKICESDKKHLFKDVKEIVFGNFAGYVYSSTDSLVISAFCGTVVVGYISNYKAITNVARMAAGTINNAIAPIWGNYLHSSESKDTTREVYYMHTFFQFIICSAALVPILCLADSFIAIWLGNQFILNSNILFLIVADIFIQNMHEPNALIMRGKGKFREDRKISVVATVVNIIISLGTVIYFGESGVLFGTAIAAVVFWIMRSNIALGIIGDNQNKETIKYWIVNIKYMLLFLIQYVAAKKIIFSISVGNEFLEFLIRGIVAEVICCITILFFFWKSQEMKLLLKNLKNAIKK